MSVQMKTCAAAVEVPSNCDKSLTEELSYGEREKKKRILKFSALFESLFPKSNPFLSISIG